MARKFVRTRKFIHICHWIRGFWSRNVTLIDQAIHQAIELLMDFMRRLEFQNSCCENTVVLPVVASDDFPRQHGRLNLTACTSKRGTTRAPYAKQLGYFNFTHHVLGPPVLNVTMFPQRPVPAPPVCNSARPVSDGAARRSDRQSPCLRGR